MSTAKRSSQLSEVTTNVEAGVPGSGYSVWAALIAGVGRLKAG